MEACLLTLEELCMNNYVSSLVPYTRLYNYKKYKTEHLNVVLETLAKLWWKDEFFFAEFLAEMLFEKMKLRGQCNDALLYLFSDISCSRLSRINVSESEVSDKGLEHLKCQNLMELDISNCHNITLNGLMAFLKYQPSLKILRMRNMVFSDEECCSFKSSELDSLKNLQEFDARFSKLPVVFFRDTLRCMTNVVHLNLEGCHCPERDGLWHFKDRALNVADFLETHGEQDLSNIAHLDLSGVKMTCLHPLMNFQSTMSTLILYNCDVDLDSIIDVVTQFDSLQVLDISKQDQPAENVDFKWNVDDEDLKQLSTLPSLTDLDLSVVADFGESALHCLRTRPTKLKFLGLAQTISCRCEDIPADVVTGNSGEKQMLATLRKYIKRPKYIVSALIDLEELYRNQSTQNVGTVIEVVVQTVKALVQNIDVVINGRRLKIMKPLVAKTLSMLLYYLTSDEDVPITPAVRSKMLDLVVLIMESFHSHSQIQMTCCFVLCNLKIPRDMDSHMHKIVHLLVQMAETHVDDQSRRISVTLLNLCACYATLKQKEEWGFQVVQIMLDIIKGELIEKKTGVILNHSWTTLWNITDETPTNSKHFMENDGLTSFLTCISDHHDDIALIQNIVGMIGNVVEVEELRPCLMNSKIVKPIYQLLFNVATDLETQYNVCGFLCHLAGCDENAWTLPSPTRDETLRQVEEEIESWDVTCQRKMSYITFKPLLRLLHSSYPLQTHYWVVWAMRNFCHCDPTKYCSFVINEGGLPLLKELVQNSLTDKRIVALASGIIDVCSAWAPL